MKLNVTLAVPSAIATIAFAGIGATAADAASRHTVYVMPSRVVAAHVMRPRTPFHYDTGGQLQWYGGPVQHVPKNYIVFWHFTSDPSGEEAYIQNFTSGLGGSSWMNIVTQYYDSVGNIQNPTGQLAGVWSDSSALPRRITQSTLSTEANRAAAHFGTHSLDANFIVATPHGHSQSGFGTQWCAYHSYNGSVAWTYMPYMTDAGYNCGENAVNPGSQGILDGVSIVGGHEIAETQTDPEPNTGWNGPGGEIGDECAWQGLGDISLSTGTFAAQPLWSNANYGCVLHYP
ncbi:MAG: hypothetical protein JO060_02865 [Candidatus Eremiobacteraeota bacterium]|nr:hypothetical protein [Candidatus Eremiobacteraeota bacterium]MBV9646246.1 hypothetical protein [Candidatus Eremiobacteraeota bacterium]